MPAFKNRTWGVVGYLCPTAVSIYFCKTEYNTGLLCVIILFFLFQDYTATIFLRQRWTDERLCFDGNKSLSLDGRLVEMLWVPDTFIVDSKKSFLHDITVENRLIRIYPNGTVLYALRYVYAAYQPSYLKCTYILNFTG